MLVRKLFCFWEDDGGTTAIEYALIGGIVSVAIVSALTAVGSSLSNTFSGISDNFDN